MQKIHDEIKKDKQIWKFSFYGLLKNLKFFEPYLLIYLLEMDMSLFKVGILYSIREIITYIFEVPSGVFADNYGKKKELMICFTFYMISFVFFFIGTDFYILAAAFIFFGLGEAFRSGTHKAMIYTYLEQKNWFAYKTFVYGRTRSFSLIGSSISAFFSIILILNLPGERWIFLICIIPYVLDFILIWSYPDSLDEKKESELDILMFFKDSVYKVKSIFKKPILTKIILSSSLYDGIFKTIKDYIQPILKITILGLAISNYNLSEDKVVKIYLGIIYGIFYIFSSIASKNVYRLNKYFNSQKLIDFYFDIMGIFSLLLFIFIKNNATSLIILVFFILYLLKDSRRPLVVDLFGDYMHKSERATVLSVESQMTSLFTIILAPLLGFIADRFSIDKLFLVLGIFIIIVNRFLNIDKSK